MIRKNAMTRSSLTSETLIASPMEDLRATFRRAFPVVAIFVALLMYAKPLHTITDVVILRKLDDFTFELAYEHGVEAGTPWIQRICKDYSAPSAEEGFAPGLILNKITFIDTGACWSLNPDSQASWFNRKDEHGNFTRRVDGR